MTAELELLKMLAESENDVREGRVSNIDDTLDNLRKKLI